MNPNTCSNCSKETDNVLAEKGKVICLCEDCYEELHLRGEDEDS